MGKMVEKISINRPVDKIEFIIKRSNTDTNVIIKNIKAVYKIDTKFVCLDLQDISGLLPSGYASKCPSGNIMKFNTGTKTVEICADYGIVGDNRDGTYSELSSCQAICRQQFSCVLDSTITDTNLLQDFREGCIEGQEECKKNQDLCRDLRVSGAKIVNENVFNARLEVTNTVINSAQVQGVNRPRPLLRTDLDYETIKKEEWKDEGYLYMLMNNNYKSTILNIGENTESSNAYSYGIEYSSFGFPIRTLNWLLKPKSNDVENGSFYFYNIIDTVVERTIIDINGNKKKMKNKIMYLRTSKDNDFFKPFAIIENYATNIFSDGVYTESISPEAKWEYKTFSGTSWVLLDKNQAAEYFNFSEIILDKPFMRIKIINDIKTFYDKLPGIIRKKIVVGPYETKFYTGAYDGTGEVVGKYTEYVLYSPNKLTYENLFTLVNNNEIQPIYDNITSSMYPKTLKNDNGDIDSNINTYLYGLNNKKDGYIRIFPKKLN